MKKIICLLCAVLGVTLLFSACGGSAKPETAPTHAPAAAEAAYVFRAANAGNFEIRPGQDMAKVLAALGEPQSYFEAASCAFDGLDKTYTYAGFVVTTYPDGEQDFVNSVRLTDDSVTTPEGVYVGAGLAAITAAYGEPAEQTETLLRYTGGNTALTFTMENGKAVSIEYLLAE